MVRDYRLLVVGYLVLRGAHLRGAHRGARRLRVLLAGWLLLLLLGGGSLQALVVGGLRVDEVVALLEKQPVLSDAAAAVRGRPSLLGYLLIVGGVVDGVAVGAVDEDLALLGGALPRVELLRRGRGRGLLLHAHLAEVVVRALATGTTSATLLSQTIATLVQYYIGLLRSCRGRFGIGLSVAELLS